MASASKPAAVPPDSFDERLARLEAIVAELEHGEIALEPAISRYQEGVELLKGCRSLLEGFQKRVEELSADAEGGTSPYTNDPDAGPDAGHESVRRTPRGPRGA
ncbi:MAG TPA: exodeoxyribonuclease VII small subunit [Thermoanaerobaculia bacterium]|nr:exodeoxyribonuclease VII small subunit [Thermoanaerobaculia bacterium]